jgi:hypothetical protein
MTENLGLQARLGYDEVDRCSEHDFEWVCFSKRV